MSDFNLKHLLNTPYSVDIDNFIQLKENFNKKYSHTIVDFVFIPSTIYGILVPKDIVIDKVEYKKRWFNVKDEHIISFPVISKEIIVDKIKLGRVDAFPLLPNSEMEIHEFVHNTIHYINNMIELAIEGEGDDHLPQLFRPTYNKNTKFEKSIEFIEEFINSGYLNKDPLFSLIKEDLEQQFIRIHKERDPIYIWNIRILLSMLPSTDDDSMINLKILL